MLVARVIKKLSNKELATKSALVHLNKQDGEAKIGPSQEETNKEQDIQEKEND